MPVLVPAVRLGAVLTPGRVPVGALSLRVLTDQYRFLTEDDLFSADIDPELGRNVFSGDRVASPHFVGMHYHRQVPPVRHGVVRNVDCAGCQWNEIEPSAGAYRWTALDAFVATAAAAGREVVFCMLATPAWASARPAEDGHYGRGSDAEPADPLRAAAFAAAVVGRYRDLGMPIRALELWNEPKFAGGGSAAQGNYFSGTPEALALMARVTWAAVKAVDPQVLVLSPSPTGFELPWIAGDRSGTDNLDRYLGADDGAGGTGARWVDAIALHTYSHSGTNDVASIPRMFDNARRCMALHGLADRAIWVTETSAISPPLSSYVAERQIAYIGRNLLLTLASGAARVVWYAWDDPLGFDQQPRVIAAWDALLDELAGARVSVVNALADARVAAVIDGRRRIF